MDQARAMMICMSKYHAYFWEASPPKAKLLNTAVIPVVDMLRATMVKTRGKLLDDLEKYSGFVTSEEAKSAFKKIIPVGITPFLR